MELEAIQAKFQSMIAEMKIGSHFPPAMGKEEGTDLLISSKGDGKIQIVLRLDRPYQSKILAYRMQELEYRLFFENDMMFLLLRPARYNWAAIPFEPRLFDTFELEYQKYYFFSLILTSAPYGTVLCVRPELFYPPFSELFYTIITELNEKRDGFSAEEYARKLQQIRVNYTPEEMAKRALYSCKLC